MKKYIVIAAALIWAASPAQSGDVPFKAGPVFKDFGPHAAVDGAASLPKNTQFKIAFDTAKAAPPGGINKTLESAARFMNMHVAAGVPKDNIDLAVVVHSKAIFDMAKPRPYKNGQAADPVNAPVNVPVVQALTENGVRIIICGQSAAYHGLSKDALLPNVEMEISAMTAHALLQQQGYTLNPF